MENSISRFVKSHLKDRYLTKVIKKSDKKNDK